MKVANFAGRKNARRVKALAANKKNLQEAEAFQTKALQEAAASKKHSPEEAIALIDAQYYQEKIQRIKKAITNTEAKVMEQGVANSLRSKKNRNGFQRVRS